MATAHRPRDLMPLYVYGIFSAKRSQKNSLFFIFIFSTARNSRAEPDFQRHGPDPPGAFAHHRSANTKSPGDLSCAVALKEQQKNSLFSRLEAHTKLFGCIVIARMVMGSGICDQLRYFFARSPEIHCFDRTAEPATFGRIDASAVLKSIPYEALAAHEMRASNLSRVLILHFPQVNQCLLQTVLPFLLQVITTDNGVNQVSDFRNRSFIKDVQDHMFRRGPGSWLGWLRVGELDDDPEGFGRGCLLHNLYFAAKIRPALRNYIGAAMGCALWRYDLYKRCVWYGIGFVLDVESRGYVCQARKFLVPWSVGILELSDGRSDGGVQHVFTPTSNVTGSMILTKK